MRIVHVTETLVAGVLAAVAALARGQSDLGHDVVVLYSGKPTVPSPAELDRMLSTEVRRVEVPYHGRAHAVLALGRALRNHAAEADVLHLHSTFAGVAGRLIPRSWGSRRESGPVIVYSPHGWAFLREDSGVLANRASLLVERALAKRCDGLALVSDSEAEITRHKLSAERCYVLRNGIATEDLPQSGESGRDRPLIVTSGRITEQKAPDRFEEIVRALSGRAEFVWIGDGSAADRERWFGSAPIDVTGWLPRDGVIERIASADVFLLTSRWEGMPISLMEAQAIGLPSVVSDIVGNRDIVLDGVTGILCADTSAMIESVRDLIDRPETRATMRANALRIQRSRLSDATLGTKSLEIYAELGATN